jgi:hypothetical protein
MFQLSREPVDVILVEVQDNNRVVIGRAKNQVSTLTDTQVCPHEFMSLVQMFHGNSIVVEGV